MAIPSTRIVSRMVSLAIALYFTLFTGCGGSSYPGTEDRRASPTFQSPTAQTPVSLPAAIVSEPAVSIETESVTHENTQGIVAPEIVTPSVVVNTETTEAAAPTQVTVIESANTTPVTNTLAEAVFYEEVQLPRGAWRFERQYTTWLSVEATNSEFSVDTRFVYQFISAPTLSELAQYPLCFTGFTGFTVPNFNGLTPHDNQTRFGTIHNIEPRQDCQNPLQTVNNHSNSKVDVSTTCSNNQNERIQIDLLSTTPVIQAGSFSVSGPFGNFSESNNVCGFSVDSNQKTTFAAAGVADEQSQSKAYEIVAARDGRKGKLSIELANIDQVGIYTLGLGNQASDPSFTGDMGLQVQLEIEDNSIEGSTTVYTNDSNTATSGTIAITRMNETQIEGRFQFSTPSTTSSNGSGDDTVYGDFILSL